MKTPTIRPSPFARYKSLPGARAKSNVGAGQPCSTKPGWNPVNSGCTPENDTRPTAEAPENVQPPQVAPPVGERQEQPQAAPPQQAPPPELPLAQPAAPEKKREMAPRIEGEQELIDGLRRNDHQAWTRLEEEFHRGLSRYVKGRGIRSHDDINDVVNETFIRFFKWLRPPAGSKAKPFDESRLSLTAALNRLVYLQVADHFREREGLERQEYVGEEGEGQMLQVAQPEVPEEDLKEQQERQELASEGERNRAMIQDQQAPAMKGIAEHFMSYYKKLEGEDSLRAKFVHRMLVGRESSPDKLSKEFKLQELFPDRFKTPTQARVYVNTVKENIRANAPKIMDEMFPGLFDGDKLFALFGETAKKYKPRAAPTKRRSKEPKPEEGGTP